MKHRHASIGGIIDAFYNGKLTRTEACSQLEQAKAPTQVVSAIRDGLDPNVRLSEADLFGDTPDERPLAAQLQGDPITSLDT